MANVLLSIVVFTAYTYLADTLERTVGVAPLQVGWWLMGFGTIGLVGNWLGGRLVDRNPLKATAAFTLMLAAGMAGSVPAARSQVRVMKAGMKAQALAGTLNVSAANAGIGLGAIIGGLTITHAGLANLGWVATAIAAVALAMVLLVARTKASDA